MADIVPTQKNNFLIEWLLLLGCLMLLGGYIGFSLQADYVKTGDDERSRLLSQARVLHDNLAHQFGATSRALENIRNAMPRWRELPDGMSRANHRLNAIAEAMPGVRTVAIMDSNGTMLAANRPQLLGQNFRERAYFKSVRDRPEAGTLYVSPPYRTVLGSWAINLMRMIPGPQGEFAGIAIATLDPEMFKTLLDSVRYADDMRVRINHGDGSIFMTAPPREELYGKTLDVSGNFYRQHVASGRPRNTFEGDLTLTGERRFIVFHTIQPEALHMNEPLMVAVSRSTEAVYANWHREVLIRIGLLALLTLLSTVSLFLLQRHRRLGMAAIAAAEVAREEQAATLERFFSLSLDLLCVADTGGRFIKLNPAWETTLGYPLHELEGRPFIDLVHPDDRAATLEAVSQLAGGGTISRFVNRYRTHDGDYRYIEWHSVPHGDSVYAAARDITPHKETEAQLEKLVALRTADLALAKEVAETANRAKTTFLANMSHELRTPLNGIVGCSALAQQRLDDPEKLKSYFATIDRASQNLLALIKDVLDIAKIEAERLTLDSKVFRLGETVENVRSLTGDQAATKGLTLAFDCPDGLAREVVRGDPLRLEQVMLNLVGNALKFTPAGSIQVKFAQTEARPGKLHLRCEVRDSGIGIAPGDQGRIFRPFEQADASPSRRYGGSGLGLAISRRLVELMDGQMGVESAPGAGSTFWFTVNLDLADDPAAVATSTLPVAEQIRARHAGRYVLIAEDEPINREVARELLEDVGLEVNLATNGAEAEALADLGGDYALILMDMRMPEMDGIEATEAIRRKPDLADTPIIAMTANAYADDRARCLAAGMNDFITKPVDPDTLYTTLLHWLDRPARSSD